MIETDEQLQTIVEEMIEHGAIWSTDENGIIKEGTQLIHMSKDQSPIFENEEAIQQAAIYASMRLRIKGYDGEPIYAKNLSGFGVRVGKKIV